VPIASTVGLLPKLLSGPSAFSQNLKIVSSRHKSDLSASDAGQLILLNMVKVLEQHLKSLLQIVYLQR